MVYNAKVKKYVGDEIKGSDIEVKYFVDRNAEGLVTVDGIPVIPLRFVEEMEEVDVLLVSPVVRYDALCSVLIERVPELRILALRDAVYEF